MRQAVLAFLRTVLVTCEPRSSWSAEICLRARDHGMGSVFPAARRIFSEPEFRRLSHKLEIEKFYRRSSLGSIPIIYDLHFTLGNVGLRRFSVRSRVLEGLGRRLCCARS